MPLADPIAHPGDASDLSPSGRYRAFKQAGLVLLCAAWILLGLFGHDPWKPDDATTFGAAYDVLRHGDWLAPQLAGAPTAERPPLFYALAAASAAALRPLLALHDGARVANALCLALTLWLLALAGRELYGGAFRWLPVLVFIGCIGLWDRAHALAPEIGLLPAFALALYALALAPRRAAMAGVLLGAAAGIAFLTRGTAWPALIGLTALLLPAFRAWRTRRYAGTLALALLVAAPLLIAWPLALHLRDPALFAQWLDGQSIARFLGLTAGSPPAEPFYYLKNLPWFAWPALPLALWTLWLRWRGYNGGLGQPGIALPVTMAVVLLVVLSAAAEPRATLALPLLLPLSLLGAAEVDTLKRGYSGALDWFGILTFGLLAALVWALWLESLWQGLPEPIAHMFRDTQPGFRPPWQPLAVLVSAFLSLLWVVLVRPARRSNRRAVLNWATGMTLVWGLYMTIWLPYLDSRRSYRPVAESLAQQLPADAQCVASHNLGEPQRALFDYFGGIAPVRDDLAAADACPLLLLQVGRDDSDAPPGSAWEKIWEGRRRGDDTERFLLFRRPAAKAS
ncbi:MAG TPA: glycosyltransferase family 39 protein [Casimicrobiaceae bacterium]|jgi:4-amino-4-deoxy-L-arabinose transferase-like glycosyltransferase